ncbi:hypothetical protein MZO42_19190 [Sphingomonas psychrotolerans]|uniref:Uncharacterized protein n=1 Tax=Sphingomonas psychrotolerans TaxID=1327635 RepID=A0ABU3N8J2_9SPHN|nr:hypothetical protein [Sphingomonas psychrotolerans]MDT8760830.1 hypothetical protein [Sphingomonas psychrotolerans]
MQLFLLTLALLTTDVGPRDKDAVRAAPGRPAAQCDNAGLHWTRRAAEPVRPGTLGNQPAANQYLAVLRREGGCDKPVKIREGIGDGVEDQR